MAVTPLSKTLDIFDHLPHEVHSIPIAKQLLIEEIENVTRPRATGNTDVDQQIIDQVMEKFVTNGNLDSKNSIILKNEPVSDETHGNLNNDTHQIENSQERTCQVFRHGDLSTSSEIACEKDNISEQVKYELKSEEQNNALKDSKEIKIEMPNMDQVDIDLENDPYVLYLLQKYSEFILQCFKSRSSSTVWLNCLWYNIGWIIKSVGILIVGGLAVLIIWDCWWEMWGKVLGNINLQFA